MICDIEETFGCFSGCIKYYCGYEYDTIDKIENIKKIIKKCLNMFAYIN